MSFKINPVEGTVAEIDVDLSVPSQHEREEFVIEEVRKAIHHIVTSLGGYLSVSCSGNINPVEGETGDVVNIYITSLPNPNPQTTTTPESAPEVQTGEPAPVTEESPQPQPPVTPENVEPSLNPEGKTNEEIEKEAQENIANAPTVEPAIEPSPVPMPEPSSLPHVTPAGIETPSANQEASVATESTLAPEGSPAPVVEPMPPVDPAA